MFIYIILCNITRLCTVTCKLSIIYIYTMINLWPQPIKKGSYMDAYSSSLPSDWLTHLCSFSVSVAEVVSSPCWPCFASSKAPRDWWRVPSNHHRFIEHTVDGNQASGNHQLRLVYSLSHYLSRFFTCQVVVWNFFHQQYLRLDMSFLRNKTCAKWFKSWPFYPRSLEVTWTLIRSLNHLDHSKKVTLDHPNCTV